MHPYPGSRYKRANVPKDGAGGKLELEIVVLKDEDSPLDNAGRHDSLNKSSLPPLEVGHGGRQKGDNPEKYDQEVEMEGSFAPNQFKEAFLRVHQEGRSGAFESKKIPRDQLACRWFLEHPEAKVEKGPYQVGPQHSGESPLVKLSEIWLGGVAAGIKDCAQQ